MFYELFFKEAKYKLEKEYDVDLLYDYVNNYYDANDTKDEWFAKVKEVAVKYNYASSPKEYKADPTKFKGHVGDICEAIRVAVTSLTQTPDLYEILKLLGKDRIIKRIDFFKENRN